MIDFTSKLSSFKTSTISCLQIGGVQSIKYIEATALNWALLNSNRNFFFNASSFELIRALPLLRPFEWKHLQHEWGDSKREVTTVKDRQWEINLSNLIFKGIQNVSSIEQTRRVCDIIIVSRLQNGVVIVDGIEFDVNNGLLLPTTLLPASLEMYETSNVFDESEPYFKLSMSTKQRQKGFIGIFDYFNMNQYYDGVRAVFAADNNSIFSTNDNSAFSV